MYMLLPPNKLKLAAGTQGGAYTLMAERYRDILARDDIEVQIVHTNGSVDNAELMSSDLVDAAFLQAGVGVTAGTAEAIGGVFYEPMIFLAHSGHSIPSNPALWRGLTIAAGYPSPGPDGGLSAVSDPAGPVQNGNPVVGAGVCPAIFLSH